jgi:hypothetical protein
MSGRALDRLSVALGLALYAALSVGAARYNAATFDEGTHLPAGYTYLAAGDYRLNPEHPPLVKMLAAAPLRLLPVALRTDDGAWQARRQWEFGRRFLYRWNDADRLLFLGRLPIIGLGLALILAVVWWARRVGGRGAAGIALLLAVLNPDMLAHGSLVTTDMGIALASFLSVAALERLADRIAPARVLAFAFALSAAVATKFSVLLFVPILALLAACMMVSGSFRETAAARLRVLLAVGAVSLVVVYVVLWATYGFRFFASSDGHAPLLWERVAPSGRLLRTAASAALDHHLLPEAYVLGFLRFFKASADRPSFLLGQISNDGFWYFFPATFLMKTPVPLLLLMMAALVQLCRERRRGDYFLWLPPVLYMALVMTRSLNIGHRHLLPIYPYLFILAARAGDGLWASGRTLLRAIVAVLLVWYAAGTLWLHPQYLAYFNELAGGPAHGYRRLVDSSLDWGQDLKALKAWMDRERVAEIKLCYFGSADPDYYGIHGERLPGDLHPARIADRIHAGDVVVISATHLAGLYLGDEERALVQRFRDEPPMARVGYTLFVYRARQDYDVPRSGRDDEP